MPHPLSPVIHRLLDSLQNALPEVDARHIRELLDAHQIELALEWIADAVVQSGLKDHALDRLLLQLGTQLGIAESIKDRLHG